ncbi:MAG: hypothetical protein AB7S26_02125 [Sandaracinaceae bacterium]
MALALLVGATAHAQSGEPASGSHEPSARDRQSAADAYDRGTAAFLAEDFRSAARWFETAHRLAPAAAALVQAVRAHQRAGNDLRAATLALGLQELYPDDQTAARTAREALEDAAAYVRVNVDCEDCAVEVDGTLVGRRAFFVEPGVEHTVVASFDTGNVTQRVRGRAGDVLPLELEAPPRSQTNATSSTDTTSPRTGEPVDDGGGGGVPLAVSIVALVVTAGLGGVLIWSGVDTLDGVPAYEENPTVAGLEDGRSREERTNWLIAGTSVAAAATLILFIFTDYGGGDDDASEENAEDASVEALLDIQADRGMLGLRGRF